MVSKWQAISLDGQDIVLDVYNKTGDARISATAFINGTEVAKREFGINISEYVILPEKPSTLKLASNWI